MSEVNQIKKIVSCYCQNLGAALNACFSKDHYKYLNLDGTYTPVEFPAEQYNTAYISMQNYIKEGKVYGVFNPLVAGQMFQSSLFTYEQVKNIALSGIVDKLKVDMETGMISCPSEIGISPVIAKLLLRMDKGFFVSSDLSSLYDKVREIWSAEKITEGFLFKKEVDLVDDLRAVDGKCMNTLKKYAFDYLLTRSEIEDITTELKSKKYIDFLKSVIDDPDCDDKIAAKVEGLVKDAVEDRKKYSFASLYKQALKSYGEKVTSEDAESFSSKLLKRLFAIVLLLLGYYSFFDANFLEGKLRPINSYAIKIMDAASSGLDRVYTAASVKTGEEYAAVASVFDNIKFSVMIAKVAFSSYELVLDFGSRLFFQLLVPLILVLCSVYLSFGCRNAAALRSAKLARIFFVFAVMLRFYTPVNAYVLEKADEYIFYNRFAANEKVIKFFAAKSDQAETDVKKTKTEQATLAKDIVRDGGETVGIIWIRSLLLPIISFVLLKKILGIV